MNLLSSDEFISSVLDEEGLEEDFDSVLMGLETIVGEGGLEHIE